MVGCFTTKTTYVDKYDLTGKRVVTDIESIPIGKVGEPYEIRVNIDVLADLSQIVGKFYDINGTLLRKGMIEKSEKIEASHRQRLEERLSWTRIFTNPQGLEFQLIQKSFCRECGDEEKAYSSQLIISGVPKKAGVYDFDFQAYFNRPYFVRVNYQLEVLP